MADSRPTQRHFRSVGRTLHAPVEGAAQHPETPVPRDGAGDVLVNRSRAEAVRTETTPHLVGPADGRPLTTPSTLTSDPQDSAAELRAKLDGLHQRMQTQASIEQAKGMLMGWYGISADAAFTVLVRWSSQSHTKLRDLAAEIVEAASQTGRPGGAALAEVLRLYSAGNPQPDVPA